MPLAVWAASPAAATTVTNEAGFRLTWSDPNETSIVLGGDITLTNCGAGTPTRTSPIGVTVVGNGHTIQQTCAGQGILEQHAGGSITLDGITLTGGDATGNGGAVESLGGGSLTVTNSTITGNRAALGGGGLHTRGGGSITVGNSTVTGNTAVGDGGGGVSSDSGSITITNSSIRFNASAMGGGGIWNHGPVSATDSVISNNNDNGTFGGGGIQAFQGPITITNSTINANNAGLNGGIGGGGIASAGLLKVTNSTITANKAGAFGGGGIAMGVTGQVTFVYATVVGNTSGTGANVQSVGAGQTSFGSVVALPNGGTNCFGGAPTSQGFNFSDDATCGFTAPSDQQNAGNPRLGALGNNGGPTPTMEPQPHSPLIDVIPHHNCQDDGATGITTDQRGFPRPVPPRCDIGAVEVQRQHRIQPPVQPF